MGTTVTPDSLESIARLALEAAQSKNYWLLLAALLSAAVWAIRTYVAPKVPFFAKPEGGVVLVLLTSFVGAITTALLGGGTITAALLMSAFKIAVGASGGWGFLTGLVFPLLLKIPFVAKLFSRGSAADEEAKAKTVALAAANANAKLPPVTSDQIANGP